MAVAFVSGRADASSDQNGYTSGTFDATGANFLAVGLSHQNTPTISDSQANTWQSRVGSVGTFGITSTIWYAFNASVSSSQTITVTSTGDSPATEVAAFSGVDATAPFDQENAAAGNFSSTFQAGSVTPSTNDQLVFAHLAAVDSSTTASIDGGFSIVGQSSFAGGQHIQSASAYLIQTTAAAANPTWSGTAGLVNSANIATFKAAAGGGGGATPTTNLLLLGVG